MSSAEQVDVAECNQVCPRRQTAIPKPSPEEAMDCRRGGLRWAVRNL